MNRIFAFLGVVLLILFVFACTMPSKVEITGSPSLKFAANMNFNDYFAEMIDDALKADGNTKTVPCTNPSLKEKVLLLHVEIFKNENYRCDVDHDSFNALGEGNIIINGEEIPVEKIEGDRKYVVLENEKVIKKSEEPCTISFKGFENYLEGFKFCDVKAKVYIYGTPLVEAVNIDLYRFDNTDESEPLDSMSLGELLVEDGDITSKTPSGIELIEEYTGLALPDGGAEIDISNIINSGGDLALKYKIYLPEGSEIDYEWIGDPPHTIVAEIVIWLPMKFESVKEDAKFKFPGFFDGISDVIKSLSETGCIETMNIKFTLAPVNPFSEGIFVISDESYGYIKSPLDEQIFLINFNEAEMDYINNNPFDPRFFVLYPKKESKLEIPNVDLLITTVSLNTELKYDMEF